MNSPLEASGSTSSTTQISSAPSYPLPKTQFYSVEYPGYVQPSSIPLAIKTLGGLPALSDAFQNAKTREEAHLECTLRPDNPFAHPIAGESVQTHKILMKVVKRKRKEEFRKDGFVGDYTMEALGVIGKTARFRSMLDFQYQPEEEDPVTKLRNAMNHLDVDAIYNFEMPELNEEYEVPVPPPSLDADGDVPMEPQDSQPAEPEDMMSNLRLFPPPVFSRSVVFQHYGYRANPASIVQTVVDEQTGEEKKRLVNKMRFKGYSAASISFLDVTIPTGPPPSIETERSKVNQDLLSRLQELLEERPAWTRQALLAQFEGKQAREISYSKPLLPLVSWVFHDGPWRDTLIRFGYDPRTDPKARFYQRLYFRNINANSTVRKQPTSAQRTKLWDDDPARDSERRKGHIFDGVTAYKDTAAFQLCDLTDPLLKELVTTHDLRESPDMNDGWYASGLYDQIRGVLRLKYFALREGRIISDEECRQTMLKSAEKERSMVEVARESVGTGRKRNRPKAKGVLSKEDAAAIRLKSAMNSAREGL
ncbi:RNA polymerase III transcription factor IIIC subunit-domain-containing protein [Flagelloscypha sp. PMI_526]|nr:RNA polymerase III transcription factor IIIC subunit-domain-containing protein [Flagelloscypha sp. PMI_526]